jgi:hypothetical protein
MAYRLASEHSTTKELIVELAAAKAAGEADVVASKLGYYQNGGAIGETVSFHYGAKRLIVDADGTATYSAGDAVYDAGSPTGTVNKTGTAGRRLVGYSLRTYPAGTNKIEIEDFDGVRAVV